MAIPDGISRDHVLAAIVDFDRGTHHSFGPSTRYDVVYEGRRYPPKAILGMAARHGLGVELTPADFSGGESSTCFRILRRLGFPIVRKPSRSTDGPSQRDVVAWVFQANPKYFDIDQYLTRQTFIYWSCPHFADQVRIGMPMSSNARALEAE